MKKPLIIVGTSAFGEIAYEYFTHESEYDVVAFAVESQHRTACELFGIPVINVEDLSQKLKPARHYFYTAITYKKLNTVRTRLYLLMKHMGYQPASFISQQASIWKNVEIGEHCFIFENNTIQAFSALGNNVVLWSGNHIGHHSIVQSNCFISSQVVVSGYCDIGENTFIGVNATLADRVKVGKNNFIGPNTTIMKKTEENRVYYNDATSPHKVAATKLFRVKSDELD